MSKADLKKWRVAFRKAVLERDGYKCKVCGVPGTDETLDPHHITPREKMPNGGYCAENGITLCKGEEGCHKKAEGYLIWEGALDAQYGDPGFVRYAMEPLRDFSPEALYKLIGSSYEKAVEAAEKLEET